MNKDIIYNDKEYHRQQELRGTTVQGCNHALSRTSLPCRIRPHAEGIKQCVVAGSWPLPYLSQPC